MVSIPARARADRAGAGWTALVLAGSRPEGDALARHFGLHFKALLPVAGEPMLARVVRSLLDAPSVERILVLAQNEAALRAAPALGWMVGHPRIRFEGSADSISLSVQAAADRVGWRLAVTTADHPLLSPAMVESFLRRAEGSDIAAALVERRLLQAAYPDARRTWLRFRGGDFTGANLFAIGSPAARGLLGFWAGVEKDRKKVWRLAAKAGPGMLFRMLTRTITLDEAVSRLGRRFGAEARPVLLDQPEAGIDVDKPDDHFMAEAILAARLGAAS